MGTRGHQQLTQVRVDARAKAALQLLHALDDGSGKVEIAAVGSCKPAGSKVAQTRDATAHGTL